MGRYQVQAPDGHTYEFEAPDDATPQQLDAMTREVAGYGKKYPVVAPEQHQPAPEQPGIGEQLVDATKNDVAGIAQGAAALPDLAAEGVGKALSIIPNLISHGLRAAGHDDAADWVQNTITHNLANPVQIGDAIESAAPTPEDTGGHVARIVGQLAGGAVTVPASATDALIAKLVGEAPEIPAIAKPAAKAIEQNAGQETAQAARDLNIDLPRFVAGSESDAQRASALEQTIAGKAPIAAATGKLLDQSEAARDAIASGVGTAAEPVAMGDEALAAAVKSNKGRRAAIGNLYNQARTLTDGVAIPPTQTADTVDNLLAQEQAKIGGSKIAPILGDIKSDLAKAGNITVDQARDLRTTLRERLTNEAGATPTNADRLTNQVMDAVNQDMATGLSAAGKGDAATIYKQADSAWAQQRTLEDEVLKPFLGKNFDNWGEDVAKKINSDAKGNGTRLAQFLHALPEENANNVRASIVGRLGTAKNGAQNAAGDAFSLDTFLTNWNEIKGARNLIFPKDTVQSLDKLSKIAEAAKVAGRTKNRSNTGSVLSYLASSAPLTLGAGETLLTHDPRGVALGLLVKGFSAVRQYGAAKLLASPAFARKLAATPMNPRGASAYWSRPWVDTMASKNSAIAGEILAFRKSILAHANDDIVSSASASPPDSNSEDQQQ